MSIDVRILTGAIPPLPQLNVPGAGAVVSFAGIVRPTEDGRAISGLNYEAYQPMAQQQIVAIAEQLTGEHKLLAMRIMHSVGWVAVGEVSFRLDIAASRRAAAFAALTEFIDRLKHDVPIWKESR